MHYRKIILIESGNIPEGITIMKRLWNNSPSPALRSGVIRARARSPRNLLQLPAHIFQHKAELPGKA